MAKPLSKQDWADDFDPSPAPPQQPSTVLNQDGTKTTTSYTHGPNNTLLKRTIRIRTVTKTEIVKPRVAARRSWAKFGLEKGRTGGPQSDTTSVGENIKSVLKVLKVSWKKDGGKEGDWEKAVIG